MRRTVLALLLIASLLAAGSASADKGGVVRFATLPPGAAGDLYVSDSFGGKIYKIDLPGGAVTTFASDELLKPAPPPHGFPPFGANGLAFSADGATLFVANTADDRILKVNTSTKVVTQFSQSINGADGIVFDAQGLLWVAANQADEVVALNADGRIVDRRGSFEGILPDGSVKAFYFPRASSLAKGAYTSPIPRCRLLGTSRSPKAT
jgi:DNA-binding beta-propeller fold protein YncE